MEYQVFHRDLRVKLGHIEGTPILETDNLAVACSFIYNAWHKEGKAMVVYQPRIECYRDLVAEQSNFDTISLWA